MLFDTSICRTAYNIMIWISLFIHQKISSILKKYPHCSYGSPVAIEICTCNLYAQSLVRHSSCRTPYLRISSNQLSSWSMKKARLSKQRGTYLRRNFWKDAQIGRRSRQVYCMYADFLKKSSILKGNKNMFINLYCHWKKNHIWFAMQSIWKTEGLKKLKKSKIAQVFFKQIVWIYGVNYTEKLRNLKFQTPGELCLLQQVKYASCTKLLCLKVILT